MYKKLGISMGGTHAKVETETLSTNSSAAALTILSTFLCVTQCVDMYKYSGKNQFLWLRVGLIVALSILISNAYTENSPKVFQLSRESLAPEVREWKFFADRSINQGDPSPMTLPLEIQGFRI